MDLIKTIRRNIAYFFGWLAISTFSLVIKLIPWRYLYGFAQNVGSLGYNCFASKQKAIARESLTIAFEKEKTSCQIEEIARNCFIYMVKSGFELVFLMGRPALLRKRVELAGEENLKSALSGGNGVILVSAHFGNFPLLMAKLSLEDYRVSGIMRAMKDQRVENMFLAKRQKLNIKTIYSQPRKTCVEDSIRCLRNNELLFIPIDQNFGTSGIFVDFFGRKAATATGPVVLAQRTQSAIIPCFIIRQKDDTHKIIFEKPLTLEKGRDNEETILINIQRLTSIIESYIRKYPAEWSWIHRRWKSKMKEVK